MNKKDALGNEGVFVSLTPANNKRHAYVSFDLKRYEIKSSFSISKTY